MIRGGVLGAVEGGATSFRTGRSEESKREEKSRKKKNKKEKGEEAIYGRLVAMMAVHQNKPRDWSKDEIALIQTVIERCWAHVERVTAEARLHDETRTLET
jgi:hypothetical protein